MIIRNTIYGIPWLDLENPTVEEIHAIIDEFGVHEDCAIELMRPSLRAKVDQFQDELFFVLHFPDHPAQKTGDTVEIDFVVHKKYIITSRYSDIDTLLVFEKKYSTLSKPEGAEIHGGTIFGLMITDLYSGLIDELSFIKKDIQDVENKIFNDPDQSISRSLITLHRKLLDCKSALRYHTDILTSFEHESIALFGGTYKHTVHGILNVYYRMTTMVDTLREIVYELRKTYDAFLTNGTNETMRILTLMSFMTFPLTLLVTIAAFPGAPKHWHTPQGFIGLLIIVIAIGATMFIFFKKKKWL